MLFLFLFLSFPFSVNLLILHLFICPLNCAIFERILPTAMVGNGLSALRKLSQDVSGKIWYDYIFYLELHAPASHSFFILLCLLLLGDYSYMTSCCLDT